MVHDLSYNLCESLAENIGGVAGVSKKTPPTPITYLTQWKIVGNSEVHGNEIWSCGEYNATDGKYHILVQPQGGSIADIALTEPLRKVNDVADSIEFPSDTEGKALVTRNFGSDDMGKYSYSMVKVGSESYYRGVAASPLPNVKTVASSEIANILCVLYDTTTANASLRNQGIALSGSGAILIHDYDYDQQDSANALKAHVDGIELIYELNTPTAELVDAPQIAEADSYSMVISQGGKAVEWSSFETN